MRNELTVKPSWEKFDSRYFYGRRLRRIKRQKEFFGVIQRNGDVTGSFCKKQKVSDRLLNVFEAKA